MAYKSRVSKNQYYGAGFAGQLPTARSTDTTDLINTLKEVSPNLEKIGTTYVEQANKKAEEKIKELFLSKDANTVRDEILSGKHPELSSQYVQKTVSFHTGKHEAAATIAKIEKDKQDKSKYDFRDPNQNLASFHKQYLPDFQTKDGSYALGFSSLFNEYKADEAIKDAANRSKHAQEKKIQQGVVILDTAKSGQVWSVANSLKLKVPPEEGGKKPRELYTNNEVNDVVMSWAENRYNNATKVEQIDEALLALKSDRKVDANGKVIIGSLANTGRKDVAALIGKLNSRRVTLENQSRAEKEYKLKEDKTNIWLKSISKKEDGTYPTLKEKEDMLNELTKLDPSDLAGISNFRKWHSTNPKDRTIASSQTERQFKINIQKGNYQTQSEMMDDYLKLGIQGDAAEYTKQWKSWYGTGGAKAIFDTNTNYVTTKESLKEIFQELYPKDALGNTTYKIKYQKAAEWIDEQIIDKEQEWKDKGIIPTSDDRRKFAKELKEDAIKFYGTEKAAKQQTAKPKTYEDIRTSERAATTIAEIQEEEQQFRAQALNTVVSTVDSGDGTIIETTVGDIVNTVSENIQRAGKQKLSKIRIEGIITEEELRKQVNEPKMKKYINSVLGTNFNTDFMAMLPQQDYNKIVMDIANAFGMIQKVPKGSPKAKAIMAQNKQALITIGRIIQQTVEGQ